MDRLVRRAVDSTSRSCSVSKASLLETLGKAITLLARPGPALKLLSFLSTLGVLASLPANALISPTATVGATPGSFAVSPSGAATYTIPIVVAPGTNGMQPNLALVYNSQGGNGLLGMGWSLAGLSVIHRCGATIEIDGFKGGVNYDANDRFCLDGERLVSIGGNEYRTHRESLQRIYFTGPIGDPTSFSVRDKDGSTREYGTTADSRIEAQGKTTGRLWAFNKITDKSYNQLTVTYTEDNSNGDYRPSSISYGANSSAGTASHSSVTFAYSDRSDVVPLYEAGSVIRIMKRLSGITTMTGTRKVRAYRLTYDNNGAVGRSRLSHVQECGEDEVCLPVTSFGFSSIPQGFTASTSSVSNEWASAGYTWRGDFNGDGKTDIATALGGNVHVRLSTGTGFISQIWSVPNEWAGADWTWTGDFNGDGKTDIASAMGGDIRVRLSTGMSFITQIWSVPNEWAGADWTWTGDFNGDGKTDIATVISGGISVKATSTGAADLLLYIRTGFDVLIGISYHILTDSSFYGRETDAAYLWSYPYQEVQAPTYVVSSVASSNGVGGANITTYQYGGLKKHLTADTSLGFRWIRTTDPAGLVSYTYNNQNREAGIDGTMAASETYSGSTRVKYLTNTWVSAGINCGGTPGTSQPRLSAAYEETRDLNGAPITKTNTTTSYESCGFPKTTVVDSNDGWRKTVAKTYNHDTANWRLGQLTRADVTAEAPGQLPQTRTSAFSYNGAGLLSSETIEPGNAALSLTTTYGHDAFGNRTNKTVSGPDIATRTETQSFDAQGRFPTTKTNALGHTSTYQYDPRSGQPTRMVDPNGLVTTWDYDGFGRKGLEVRPDNTRTIISYNSATCPAAAASYSLLVQSDGTAPVCTYYDILSREIRTATIGYGGVWIHQSTRYDALGRVEFKSHPEFNAPSSHGISYAYDVLGRVTAVTMPGTGNRTTTTQYNGLTTTVTNALGQEKTTVKNSQGKVIEAIDAAGTTRYEYDPFLNLTQVTDVAGNVTTMTYDIRGRKTSMREPNMGDWVYGYDVLNQLTSQRDAKNQTLSMTYDKLGRLTTRVTPEGTSTWTYETATKGIGKLASLTGPNGYQEQHLYDTLSRPSQTITTIAGTNYAVVSGYDLFSRLSTVTYPSTGYQVKQIYDAHGHLWQVNRRQSDGTETLVWMTNAADAHSRITQEFYGNGVVGNRAYDHETGDLQTIQTGFGTSSANAQNLSYGFDAIGNLKARNDAITGLNETFEYDNLNRLTRAVNSGASSLTKTYQYSAVGNITYKSDVGTYAYPASGPNSVRPHAVTGVSGVVNATYAYDANGNMTSGAGRSIAWTSFNKPATVTQNGQTTSFGYDPNYKRIQKTGGGKTTVYVGKLYERVTTGTLVEHKHYVYGGSSLVATYTSRNNGTEDTKYLHPDHLGSINVITNGNGQVVERLSFDPHGKRRQTNGLDATGTITSTVNRGFTRHEHDDEVGLINMNARLYDPLLGRFISPDSVIDGPTSQGLNRYSYVRNNPLSLTDPTGNFSLKRAVKRLTKNVKRVVNKWGRTVVAAVAAYYTFNWATMSYWQAAGQGVYELSLGQVYAGYVAGSAAAGGVAGGIIGGDLKSAWKGAVGGAISGGLTFGADMLTRNWVAFGQMAARAAAAGTYADLNGGNFAQGFKNTFGIETLSYAAVEMRRKMIEQSTLDPRNASGESEGFRGGYGFKVGGCRYAATCLPSSEGDVLGGVQGGQGRFFGHRYNSGDFFDGVVEAYSGPHDFLNSFMYDAKGNLNIAYQQGIGYWVGQGASAANVFVATPLVVSSVVQPMLPYATIIAEF